ncbi:non-ribosomal peptide synthetase [Motilimonas eburnea]|uniref:non-ribosomal peptide synthetase n=1 Tax=Motilimonas eburnea TaxID=1737488 RepID=UPI001E44CD83|nr:non-ribosomal peptide synthetase [Motilimonas eburnea]MCE2573782.1 amino acid adenylation domain-containing protein [Motilimonas eburnea]
MSMEALIQHCLSESISLSLNGEGGIDIHAETDISPQTIDMLKANKAELIRYLQQQQQKQQPQALSTITATGAQHGPLSFAQQRLWLIDQIDGESSQYNLATALKLTGALNVAALEQAISHICMRHQILRTCYLVDPDEQVQQVVQTDWQFKLAQIDLSELSEQQRGEQIQALIEQDSARSFNLSQELMLRATLIKEQSQQYVLLITMHHIASDGWSRSILCDEMFALYNDFCAQRQSALAPLPIQYLDYAQWQRRELAGDKLEQLSRYWLDKLAGHAGQHNLPLDKARPKASSFKGKTLTRTLDVNTRARWQQFAQQSGATLFMLLHAGLVALMARYSNDTDIVIGTPTANRDNDQLAPLVGFFVNSLALRTEFNSCTSFKDLLQLCRDCLLEAFEHQQAPFEYIVEQMQVERHLNLSPVFQVMLALQNNAAGIPRLAGVDITPLAQQTQHAKFDLSLDVVETNNGLELTWEYACDIFTDATVANMAEHFELLMAKAMATPEQAIFALPMLSDAQQQQQLALSLAPSLAEPRVDLSSLLCIHQLLERQAKLNPDAIAIHAPQLSAEYLSLSYGDLNRQANQLARYLQQNCKVNQADYVALLVERSAASLVAILAILKLGAAYLPLDPNAPSARLKHMLEDSGTALVLTQSNLAAIHQTGITTVILDEPNATAPWASLSGEDLDLAISAEQVAYVIYTSGSTGQPKGVLQTHQTITNLVVSTAQKDGLTQPLRTLQFTPLTFDVSIQELATAWHTGSELVLMTVEQKAQLQLLPQLINEQQIARLFVPPAVLQLIAEQTHFSQTQLSCLREVIVAGEALYMSKELRQFFDAHSQCQLWNHYGPTETHVATTFNATSAPADSWPAIGQAIDNLDTLILGPKLELLPAACVGELYVGGLGLAQGYLNQGQLTAEKFIEHPYRDNAKLYQTGDLVKRTPDGQLQYIGRRDNQVKLRGFRIELGEVEAKLSSCDGVLNAVVLLKQDEQQQKHLVAYVKVANEQISAQQISAQLQAQLPDYMQPSQLIVMDTWPLNRNGKVDRHALPEPDWQGQRQTYQAPTTSTQIKLGQIWQQVLKQDPIGLQDNFFQLGGHSLSATRVIAKVNHEFAINLAVKQLFEHQTLAQLAKVIEQEVEQEVEQETANESLPFNRVDRSEPILASFAQQRLWLVDHIQGSSAHYNMHQTLLLEGDLDVGALQRAFTAVIERHESLRTCFASGEQGQVYQVIQDPRAFSLAFTDISDLAGEEKAKACEALIEQEAKGEFDLASDLMLRAQLIKLASNQHQLLVTLHHIAADGWSVGLLMQELSQIYTHLVKGEALALAPLAYQYADYSHWQQRWFTPERLNQELDYWQQQLAELPALHSLPLDYPRPDIQTYRGAQVQSVLPPTTRASFNALCQEHGATLFMGLHSALAYLMASYSHSTDIVIGTPIANREQAEVAPMIGFFINNLVLRADVSGLPSFAQLLAQSKTTLLEAYSHQQTPFEQVIERLQPERSASHSPLFQILLVLQNNEMPKVSLPSLQITEVEQANQVAKYDLTISVNETEQGLSLSWEYNADLFKAQTIAAMAQNFNHLVSAVTQTPEQPIARLNWISASEQQQLIEWNQSQQAYPDTLCVQQLFAQTSQTFAEQLAVTDGQGALSYRQLDAKANQLAHYLRQTYQVGPEQIIGVCLSRSVDTLVTLLAILKAGGAYLPLDPNYPAERLAYMLADSQAPLVITQAPYNDMLAGLQVRTARLVLDQVQDEIDGQSSQEPVLLPEQNNRNLAYVIYTSGTTGKPKGTLLEHRGAVNLAYDQGQRFFVTPQSKVLQFASLSFDAATFEWLMALMQGASLHICSEESRTNPDLLQQLLVEQKITHATLPPSLLPHLDIDAHYALEALIVAGEACDPRQAERWSQRYRLINAYGPSETTVCASMQVIEPGAPLTIGRAIANTQLYVLDSHLSLLPVGAIGELYIGGDGVGRGYLNREDLTAQRFIEHSFNANEPVQRLYKTGDLVRWLPNGQLLFLGRVDHQVKIRGFRIELGEIEQSLLACEGVKQGVVLAHQDKLGQSSLVAYLVAKTMVAQSGDSVSNDQLIASVRTQLAAQLPDYMVPSVIMVLPELPLSRNGKLDRSALPSPQLELSRTYVAPTTELEKQVCEIWQGVLNQEQVGLQDNFFQLGGHSLTATQVMAKINQWFDLAMPVKTLFQVQTVAELVAAIESETTQTHLKITAHGPLTEAPLSFAQQRLWLLSQIEGANAHYNMPTAIRLTGQMNVNALEQAMQALVERHAILRTGYDAIEPKQVIKQQVQVKVHQLDLKGISQDEQEQQLTQLMQQELETGFDLVTDLMLRATLVALGDNEHVLLVTQHHIASDGWSVSLLMQEFSQLYSAFAQGLANPLAPLAVQYSDYAIWQRQWLQGEYLDQQLGYWQQQLADLPRVHSLPLDRARPNMPSFNGAMVSQVIAKDTVIKLQQVCQQHQATLFMGLNAAFAALLSRYSNEKDIVIGSAIANREQGEVAPLLGFFVNNLVLRSDLSANPSFSDLLAQSKQTCLDAYDHQQVPFEQLVDMLQPERSVSHTPLFQVMLVLQNNQQGQIDLPELEVTEVPFNQCKAKYDLTLYVRETEQGLALNWEYSQDLFYRQTIEQLAASFATLLNGLLAAPEQSVFAAPILSAQESHYLVSELNDTSVCLGQLPLPQLFLQQAQLQPNKTAVCFGNSSLSYQALNQQANQLARHLIAQGVGRNDLVAISVERSEHMLVALLAIFKAGGAYVALDPSYPPARLAYMLADSGAKVVISQSHLLEVLALNEQLVVDLDNTDVSAYSSADVSEVTVTDQDLAYVIYTSGSTGQPKGVMIQHGALSNFLLSMQQQPGLTAKDSLLAVTSLSFDIHTLELYLPLITGAKVVIASRDDAINPSALRALIAQHQVSVMQATPATWNMLLDDGWQASAPLKVLCGGEALSLKLKQALTQQSHIDLWNMYGPTETCVWSSVQQLSHESRISLGRPIANTQFYVVDQQLQPVPKGVAGELLIGGAGLAKGYFNRPALTAEKFTSENKALGRVYRTGDLVRYLPSGELEYLGRLDHQVKIRGFRIELGEIESRLIQHPDVAQCVVMAQNDPDLIAAYVVTAAPVVDQGAFSQQLRSFLSEQLPDYMLPNSLMLLAAMPLTANGKIDRKALPAPDLSQVRGEYVAPVSATEQALAELWQQTLGVTQVGRDDNFFQLGGHSLAATKLVTKINSRFNINLALKDFFAIETLAHLAQAVDKLETLSSVQLEQDDNLLSDEVELTI